MVVYAALFAALTAVGAFLFIPIGPVPIVLQNMFVYLAGLLLGSRWGLASIGVYLLVGAVGLPVFAGGLGGISRFVGPTGGYLVGYLPTVFLIGKIAHRDAPQIIVDVLAMICGTLVLYACGVTWLKIVSGMPLGKTLALGVYPFLIGDAVKIAAAAAIARALRPVVGIPVKF
jgi:biotin transport system substrate-specific component